MTSRIQDNETFITLVRVAESDPSIRNKLVAILSLDKSHRAPLLHTLLDESKFRQRPKDFIAAVSYLLTEDIADTTLDHLRKELGEDPALTQSIGRQLIFAVKLLISIPATAAAFWFVGMGVLAGLESAGIHGDLSVAFVAAFIGAALGGLVIVNRSWLFLMGLAGIDILIMLVLKLTETGP
jgi:hypothetical protein